MNKCECVDCIETKSLEAVGLTNESRTDKIKISFDTNCGFFESRYQGFFYGSNKPYLDGNIITFLKTHYDKGVKVTLEIIENTDHSKCSTESKHD